VFGLVIGKISSVCIRAHASCTPTNETESHIQNPEERASLITNFKIQRDWSEMTMLCKGLQGMGIENVA
jgi:hypothetical protein